MGIYFSRVLYFATNILNFCELVRLHFLCCLPPRDVSHQIKGGASCKTSLMLTIFFRMRDTKYMNIIDRFFPRFNSNSAIYEYKTCHIVGMYKHFHIYDTVILSKKFKPRNRREHKDGNRRI